MSFEIRRDQIARLRRQRYVEQLDLQLRQRGARASLDPKGNLFITDVADRATRLDISDLGFPTSVTSPEGRRYSLNIDKNGRLLSISNPADHRLSLSYDPAGRITSLSSDGALVWRLGYDPPGRLTDVTYHDGTSTRLSYDVDRLATTNRLGHTETFEFDGPRLVTLTDGNGHPTRFEYGRWERPIRAVHADATVEEYDYDENGSLTAVLWANGARAAVKQLDGGKLSALEYDDGDYVRVDYDKDGHPIAASAVDEDVSFEWNDAGWLVAENRDGSRVLYAHDAAQNLASLTYPGGDRVQFGYDKDDRLVSVLDWSGNEYRYRYATDDTGYILSTPGDLSTTVRLSRPGVPTFVGVERQDRRVFTTELEYDAEAHVISINDSDVGETRYTYDSEGQVLNVRSYDSRLDENFSYDPAGNRTRWNDDSATFGRVNELERQGRSTCAYDLRGNTISVDGRGGRWRLTWSQRNLLVAADGPNGERVTFRYDGYGRRISKRIVQNGGQESVTRFTWAGEQLITQVTRSGQDERRYDFLYIPGSFVPLAMRLDGSIYTYHCDHRGAPTRLTDPDGKIVWTASYRAFGEAVIHSAEVDNPLRLPGQWLDDETGFHYNRFRYYSPRLGRFLSRDPLSFLGGPNLYAYVGNDPINRTDPLGLWWKGALSAVAGVAVAAAVVLTAPVSVPLLAGAAVLGVATGLGVHKALSLKEPNAAEIGKGFLSGFVSGALLAGAVVAAAALVPAAATAIAVVGAGVAIYAMCQEHAGWHLLPWEDKSVPFSQMTPAQQNRSLGGLVGAVAGAGAVGGAVRAFRSVGDLVSQGAKEGLDSFARETAGSSAEPEGGASARDGTVPGVRASTAEQRAATIDRSEVGEVGRGGHMHKDHGHQTTVEQQTQRIQTGVTPSGYKGKPVPRSTKFDTPEAELEARDLARKQLDNAPKEQDGEPAIEVVTVEKSNGSFGSGVQRSGYPNSVPPGPDGVKPVEPIGPLKKAKMVMQYNPSTGEWDPITGYPVP